MSGQPIPCPCCGSPMTARLIDLTTVDTCDSCGGLWFDGGELEKVIDRPLLAQGSFPQYRQCPHCQQAMKRVVAGTIGIERCPSCGGHFLDAGELEQLPGSSRQASEPQAPVPPVALPEEEIVRDFDCIKCGGHFPIEKGYSVPGGRVCDRCSGITSEEQAYGPFDKFLDAVSEVLAMAPDARQRRSRYRGRRFW